MFLALKTRWDERRLLTFEQYSSCFLRSRRESQRFCLIRKIAYLFTAIGLSPFVSELEKTIKLKVAISFPWPTSITNTNQKWKLPWHFSCNHFYWIIISVHVSWCSTKSSIFLQSREGERAKEFIQGLYLHVSWAYKSEDDLSKLTKDALTNHVFYVMILKANLMFRLRELFSLTQRLLNVSYVNKDYLMPLYIEA